PYPFTYFGRRAHERVQAAVFCGQGDESNHIAARGQFCGGNQRRSHPFKDCTILAGSVDRQRIVTADERRRIIQYHTQVASQGVFGQADGAGAEGREQHQNKDKDGNGCDCKKDDQQTNTYRELLEPEWHRLYSMLATFPESYRICRENCGNGIDSWRFTSIEMCVIIQKCKMKWSERWQLPQP